MRSHRNGGPRTTGGGCFARPKGKENRAYRVGLAALVVTGGSALCACGPSILTIIDGERWAPSWAKNGGPAETTVSKQAAKLALTHTHKHTHAPARPNGRAARTHTRTHAKRARLWRRYSLACLFLLPLSLFPFPFLLWLALFLARWPP